MKKKLLPISILGLTFVLTGCQNTNPDPVPPIDDEETVNKSTSSLSDTVDLLVDSLYRTEVYNSSEVSFKTTTQIDESTTQVHEGTMEIYSDEHASETGSDEITYDDGSTYKDTYTRYLGIDSINNQRYLSRVTDYNAGNVRSEWVDSAYRLPVLTTEDPDLEEGEDYLLEGSAVGQLTYQVSLYLNNFIAGNLLNNVDLAMATLPDVNVEEHLFTDSSKGTNYTTYTFDLYQYNYEDEGDTITNGYEFSFKLDENDRLVEGKTVLHYTQQREDEVYKETTTDEYSLKYETRKTSSQSTTLLNPDDYFLSEVTGYRAYYLSSNYEEIEVDLNENLPLHRYIWFVASEYKPEKAIDLTLRPVSTTNEEVVEVNSENIYTVGPGRATVVFETATGIRIRKDIVVNDYVEIESINYTDASSGIEIGDVVDGKTTRYIYTDTTYNGIRVSGTPSSSLKSDIKYEITEGEDLISLTDNSASSNYYDFTLAVVGGKAGDRVTIKFTCSADESISYEVTYIIKERLSVDELYQKILVNEYNWDNLYGESGGVLKFTSRTTFEVTYYGNFADKTDVLGTNSYSFTLNESNNTLEVAKKSGEYDYEGANYNGGEIRLDGEVITLTVNDTDYVHRYTIAE